MQLKPGSLICGGKYRIEKVLGQGGFGITYLAEQTSLGRRVALKEFFMKEHCDRETSTSYVTVPSAGSRELVERFRQKFIKEARQIATFGNSHIVRVIDVFEDNGTAYYAMEYLDGKSLESIVREQGSLSEADAVKYIRDIADALSEVHARNFLHLDVKPANVMLNKKDEAVLIDFGISKHYDDSGSQTSSGLMAFSDGYAPLEQYNRGGLSDFTPAIDIYALGATLFRLLTGKTPPHASVVNDDGLPALPQNISPAVRHAVETAMQPRRKDRPQSIADFLALLGSVAPRTGGAAVPGMAAEPMTFADDAATEISPVHNVPPAPSRQTPPPAVEAPRRDAPAPERKSSDNRSGTPKKSKAPLFLLLLLLLAVIAGGAWYVSNGSGGNDNGANGGNAMKETVVPSEDAAEMVVVDDVVLVFHRDENGKYGFTDRYGNEVIPCTYDYVDSFSEGLARICVGEPDGNGKWGFIDKNGNEVIPLKYDGSWCFSEGLAPVELDGKWGFIDKNGNVVIPFKYDYANSFSEGLALVRLDGKSGFIDKSGNEVIPFKYDWAWGFSEGLAVVVLDDKQGMIDKNGNVVIPFKYDDLRNEFSESEGLTRVILDSKWGFIDKSGNEVVPFKYDLAWFFHEGLARVELNGKWGFIDKSGNVVVPCKYDDAGDFSEGLARVELDGKWGFVDKSGNEVVPCKYGFTWGFSEGLASVNLDGKYGFIDKSGSVVIPFKYDDASSFSEGQALVKLDGREFYIDKNGNEIK